VAAPADNDAADVRHARDMRLMCRLILAQHARQVDPHHPHTLIRRHQPLLAAQIEPAIGHQHLGSGGYGSPRRPTHVEPSSLELKDIR
jgi:hypothetical protein